MSTRLSTPSSSSTTSTPSWLRQRWNAATGVVGVLVGLAPHVLHHVGALAGTALVAGSGGTSLSRAARRASGRLPKKNHSRPPDSRKVARRTRASVVLMMLPIEESGGTGWWSG